VGEALNKFARIRFVTHPSFICHLQVEGIHLVESLKKRNIKHSTYELSLVIYCIV
jgi:hypothetical protein